MTEAAGRHGPADVQLATRTWEETEGWAAGGGSLLAVPVGATEQHGPHLPLSTDTEVACELCRRLAERRADTLVAPALSYGASGEHAGFPGTISIGQQVLQEVAVELARSAGDFAGLVFVNAHGGNLVPLHQAEHRLRQEGRHILLWSAGWEGDAHAGRTETSLALALVPGLVRRERARAGNRRPLPELMDELRRSSVRAVSPNGVLGDPASASAAEGSALLAQLTEDLVATVGRWHDRKPIE